MHRRSFLEAAATASALPLFRGEDDQEDGADGYTRNLGADGSGAFAAFATDLADYDSDIHVRGHPNGEAEPMVEVRVGMDFGTLMFDVTPEEADAVAADLRAAAAESREADK